MAQKNIWYVKFPTFQYNEDVKALASKAGLKVIDAQFYDEEEAADKTPKLTFKKEAKEDKKADEAKEDKKADEDKTEGGK